MTAGRQEFRSDPQPVPLTHHGRRAIVSSKLKGVIFDLDGVIADTEPFHAWAYVQAFQAFSIHISLEDYRDHVTVGGTTLAEYFAELGGDPRKVSQLYALKDRLVFPKMTEELQPRPGVVELVRGLHAQGVACGIATSSRSKNAEFVTKSVGIRQYFAHLIGMEHVRHVKPDPELFVTALQRMGLEPEATLVVEDSPKGLQAAVAAGIRTVVTPTDWTRHCRFDGAALIVDSLEGITPAALDDLLA